MIDFAAGPISPDLDVHWIHGQPRRSTTADPPLQVHWVDDHTVIMRQSKQLTYEAPFLYLLFGNDSALLLDTGAVRSPKAMPLRVTVDRLVDEWLDVWLDEHGAPRPSRASYRLVVAHTHGHSDHVAGDRQFDGRPNTTVVPADLSAVRTFFGFSNWPREQVIVDLGGRQLTITGLPGHHEASIAVYDPWTGFLLTGDTVYPGRLYVNDAPAFTDSLDALVDLVATNPVTAVMGCHIEMTTTPTLDYPIGTRYQPDEPPLPMSTDQLQRVRNAARAVQGHPGVHVFDDFSVFNGRCVAGMIAQVARANGQRLRALVS